VKQRWNAAAALKWALVFGLGVTTGIVAQTVGDLPQRVEQKRADLSGAPGMEVVASVVELKPGEESRLHSHHGIEAAYVLQGATVQAPGQAPMQLAAGTTLLNLRDVKHGAFKVVGDQPLRYFAVHVVDKGKPLYDYGN
jgi:quercetin dioxygenase-like cupin family protein